MNKNKKRPIIHSVFASSGVSSWLLFPGFLLLIQSALLLLSPLALVYGVIETFEIYEAEKSLPPLLYNYAALTLIALVVAALSHYAGVAWCAWLASKVVNQMRARVAETLTGLDNVYWRSNSTIAIRQHLEDNLDIVRLYIAQQLPAMVRSIFIPLLLIIVMLIVDWRLALVSLLPLPLAFFLVIRQSKKKYKEQLRTDYYSVREELHKRMIEYFGALPAIKIYGSHHNNQEQRATYLSKSIDDYYHFMQKWIASVTPAWSRFFSVVGNLLLPVLAIAIWLYQQQQLSVQVLLLFSLLGVAYVRPLFALANSGSQLALVRKATEKFESALIQKDAEVPESNKEITVKNYNYSLKNVSYFYGNHCAINDLTLDLPASGCIAIVGPTGSGKSTLAMLLAGIAMPTSGVITLGGFGLGDLSRERRTSYIAPVWQQSFLLQGTFAQNIALEDMVDNDRVENAINRARLTDVVKRLPQGIETNIEHQSGQLSGGELQRVQIARALYQQNPIVILDEATAFNDVEHEQALQQAIAELVECRLLIVISHRLRTIQNADLIVLLDRGKLEATGTHQQLLESSPVYSSLWNSISL